MDIPNCYSFIKLRPIVSQVDKKYMFSVRLMMSYIDCDDERTNEQKKLQQTKCFLQAIQVEWVT